uniref:Uncharacterized protein n=1 Tax=Opuntia streptacantha TaxID=393608 RepID=A0A7C9AMG7_OPUST
MITAFAVAPLAKTRCALRLDQGLFSKSKQSHLSSLAGSKRASHLLHRYQQFFCDRDHGFDMVGLMMNMFRRSDIHILSRCPSHSDSALEGLTDMGMGVPQISLSIQNSLPFLCTGEVET